MGEALQSDTDEEFTKQPDSEMEVSEESKKERGERGEGRGEGKRKDDRRAEPALHVITRGKYTYLHTLQYLHYHTTSIHPHRPQ